VKKVFLAASLALTFIGCASKGSVSNTDKRYELIKICGGYMAAMIVADTTLLVRNERSEFIGDLSNQSSDYVEKILKNHSLSVYLKLISSDIGEIGMRQSFEKLKLNFPITWWK
jgi:hypothetical protein